MSSYEFKLVPAPSRGFIRSVFSDDEAMTLTDAVNTLAEDGWTFVRSDRRPVPVRPRLLPGVTAVRDVLVFRRPTSAAPSGALGLGRAPARDPDAFARDVADLLPDFGPLCVA